MRELKIKRGDRFRDVTPVPHEVKAADEPQAVYIALEDAHVCGQEGCPCEQSNATGEAICLNVRTEDGRISHFMFDEDDRYILE